MIREILRKIFTYEQRKKLARIKIIYKYDNPVVGYIYSSLNKYYKTDNCKFLIPNDMVDMGFRSRFYFNVYELEERQLVKKYIRPDDKVIELGACIGVISSITNKLLTSPESKHLVIEANPNLIPWIYKNKTLNKSNFKIEFCALSQGTTVTFYLNDLIVGGSLQKEGVPTEVPARSLLELEEKYGQYNVMIMDIEGGEYDVLRNSESLLEHYRLLIIELHEDVLGEEILEECRNILRKQSFTMLERMDRTEVWEKK
jgi:FkbM family methyltransferase